MPRSPFIGLLPFYSCCNILLLFPSSDIFFSSLRPRAQLTRFRNDLFIHIHVDGTRARRMLEDRLNFSPHRLRLLKVLLFSPASPCAAASPK